MNDITTTPTADLIAEWKRLDERGINAEKSRDETLEDLFSRIDAIAAELDRRYDDAGISVDINGAPNFANCGHSMDGSFTIYSNATREHIPAAELRNLLTWLLLKEGVKISVAPKIY